MAYNPNTHNRHSIRLKGYNYSQPGLYFVTICVHEKECVLGKVGKGYNDKNICILNEYGIIAEKSWEWLDKQYEYISLDRFVIMPNHMHGIIKIADCRGGSRTALTEINRKSLGSLIGAFKTVSTKEVNKKRRISGLKLWQRNYYEQIIRDKKTYYKVKNYIINNPKNWVHDEYYPAE